MVHWIQSILNGKQEIFPSWNIFLFIKNSFNSTEVVTVPVDKTLVMASPSIDGELYIDGEVYIL